VQRVAGRFIYSASDLNNDLECRRLTWLENQLVLGNVKRPETGAALDLIAGKGDAHEARYLAGLRTIHGNGVVAFEERVENTRDAMLAAEARTLEAMASGAQIIYQATFFDGTFLGRTDFLRRVETPSAKWAWSYEVIDTKLALQPKAYFLLQLCNYSEHVARLQGTMPVYGHLVLGSGLEAHFRVDDYAAYYRHQKTQFLARAEHATEAYPAEIGHCLICRWTENCEAKREADDYLGIVAWMRTSQIDKFVTSGITTIGALGAAADQQRPLGMVETSFSTLRAQAALQHRQRTEKQHFYELLAHEERRGFSQLPPPDDGDIYFDMEGDPLYTPERGLEYLFGVHLGKEGEYRAFWARNLGEERAAFEAFIDFVVQRREQYPDMHVYHYAPYETVALRRLMGEFGTREIELDTLLRAQIFVDLYAVVRQSIRISQPSYSIKKLEPFYGMVRNTDVKRGDDSIIMFETWLVNGDESILEDIEQYNNDDCRSTWLLHKWLLERRDEYGRLHGADLPWREAPPPPKVEETTPADELAARLLAGLPEPQTTAEIRNAEESVRARWLLGHLLQYHRREAKPGWWKVFDGYENADQLTEFNHEAIGDLTWCEDATPYKLNKGDRNLVHTYEFPDQLYNLGHSDPHCPHTRQAAGKVVAIDDDRNRIQIKLAGKIVPANLRALIPGGPIDSKAQKAALHRLATAYEAGTIREQYPAAYNILLRATPRLRGIAPGATIQPAEITGDAIAALVGALDRSYLFIQGPPGSGKSTTGGDAIAALLKAKKRIGIVSRGYAAIQNLLHKVEESAVKRGITFAGLQRHSQDDQAFVSRLSTPMIENTTDNDAFGRQAHQLAAGTPWLFSREEMAGQYDVLFIDEAGQLSLGDAIACAGAAQNVVLLGDPLQLAQVSQGSHPIGTSASVLEHLLGEHHTVPADRGVFLNISYRMHPEICAFISRTVYDDRLSAAPTTAANRVVSDGLSGAGLRYLPVVHHGNSRESTEEADRIADAVDDLLRGRVVLPKEPERKLTTDDILVVTPYNAQRLRIGRTLAARGHAGIRVGTVDKFQGQEAAVVFYSMATSSAADMPRDLSFLFEKNRFNVAISRAQCLSILVCSPELLEVRTRTPFEMMLASLLCGFVEAATCTMTAPRQPSQSHNGATNRPRTCLPARSLASPDPSEP
jgi:predicted RecB family nuclease